MYCYIYTRIQIKILKYLGAGSCTGSKDDEAVTRFLPKQCIFIISSALSRNEVMHAEDQEYLVLYCIQNQFFGSMFMKLAC